MYMKELLEENTKKYKLRESVICCIPDDIEFTGGFVSADTIFVPDSTYETCLINLRKFAAKNGKYKLLSYDGTKLILTISYQFEQFKISFYITDAENALEKISQGKCKFETITDTPLPKTTTTVVCPTQGGADND